MYELLVWEAFVSGKAKDGKASDPHIADARAAALEFRRRMTTGSVTSDIDEQRVLNTSAAAIMATGMSSDATLLTTPCLVIKAPNLHD